MIEHGQRVGPRFVRRVIAEREVGLEDSLLDEPDHVACAGAWRLPLGPERALPLERADLRVKEASPGRRISPSHCWEHLPPAVTVRVFPR